MNLASSPLLDLAESNRRARSLRSWAAAQKESVRLRFAVMLAGWAADWLPARDPVADEGGIGVSDAAAALRRLPDDAAHWVFETEVAGLPQRLTVPALHAIAGRMFGFDSTAIGPVRETSPVAAAVAQAAWDDWLRRIAALIGGLPLQPADTAGSRGESADAWSGALDVRLPWCGGIWHLWLPWQAVERLLGADAAPRAVHASTSTASRIALDKALAARPIGVRVVLAGAELSLGQLQDLRPGDVVPLEQALDAPAQVVTAEGTPICEGWLGRKDGRIAVELALPVARAVQPSNLSNPHT